MRSERRLHPLSVLFAAAKAMRAFLLPILFMVFAAGSRAELWFAILIIPSVLSAIVRYISYRYVLTDDELVIKTGILFRNERHVPYSRIHNIAVAQNLFHRMFGVVEVRVETAGGSEPEARMSVLSVQARDEMRDHIFRHKQQDLSSTEGAVAEGEAPPIRPAERSVLRLPTSELLLHGVIDNRGMIVVGAAMGLAYQAGLFEPGRLPSVDRGTDLLRDLGSSSGFFSWFLVGATALLGFLLLLRLFSIAAALLTFHGFELRSNGTELRTMYGLFTRNTSTIPLHRIQLLSIRQKPMQRWFRRMEVQADTAGGNPSENADRRRPRLAPLLREGALDTFLQEVQPGINLAGVNWRPVHGRAARRILRISLVVGLLVTAGVLLAVGRWGALIAVPAVILAWFNAYRQARSRSWAVSDEAILYKKGWIWKRLTIARIGKIQALSVAESLFDRRWGMATLQVDTAGGRAGSDRLRVRFLDREAAKGLLETLGARTADTAFHW